MIQRNLRHDTTYTILSSWYISLEDGGSTCQNCNRVISNCCEVQSADGKTFTVGMDCAATLAGITDTWMLSSTEASFQQAKSARAKVIKFRKNYPDGTIRIETLPAGKGYYKEANSGIVSCSFSPPQGEKYYSMKQYPADIWMAHILPMIKGLNQYENSAPNS